MKTLFQKEALDEIINRTNKLTATEWSSLMHKHLDHHLNRFGV